MEKEIHERKRDRKRGKRNGGERETEKENGFTGHSVAGQNVDDRSRRLTQREEGRRREHGKGCREESQERYGRREREREGEIRKTERERERERNSPTK